MQSLEISKARRDVGLRFGLTTIAALLNGVYWRVDLSRPAYLGLVGSVVLLSTVAILLNARSIRNARGPRDGSSRRLSLLLMVTAILVLLTVFINLSGLRQSWGLA